MMTDVNQTRDDFPVYTNIKSFSCTPETNTVYVTYTSVFKLGTLNKYVFFDSNTQGH